MRNSRLTQLWNERPWRRRKQEKEKDVHKPEPEVVAPLEEFPQDTTITGTLDRNARRLSRIWRNDGTESAVPSRSNSFARLRKPRSFFKSNDEPVLLEDDTMTQQEPLPPPLERETILKKIRRRSQSLSLSRPSTSTGVPRRHTFFGGAADEDTSPAVPVLPDLQGLSRPRHVPISIDYLRDGIPPSDGPGMAITSNEVQSPVHAFVEKPRARPMSSSSSFSQLRVRPARTTFQSSPPIGGESESSDDDVLTALPSMEFKEFHMAELRVPTTYTVPPPPERHIIRRVVPKVVDIVSPRPLSMISAQPARKSAPPSRDRERHKSLAAPVSTPIGALEDGPKGDWSRTRHSWVGIGDGEFEQLEWDKLKQFMEAYGNGHEGVVSVRAVGTDSDSSGSARNSNSAKFANAQALAALEFGL